jgi:hypothetical protein
MADSARDLLVAQTTPDPSVKNSDSALRPRFAAPRTLRRSCGICAWTYKQEAVIHVFKFGYRRGSADVIPSCLQRPTHRQWQ